MISTGRRRPAAAPLVQKETRTLCGSGRDLNDLTRVSIRGTVGRGAGLRGLSCPLLGPAAVVFPAFDDDVAGW